MAITLLPEVRSSWGGPWQQGWYTEYLLSITGRHARPASVREPPIRHLLTHARRLRDGPNRAVFRPPQRRGIDSPRGSAKDAPAGQAHLAPFAALQINAKNAKSRVWYIAYLASSCRMSHGACSKRHPGRHPLQHREVSATPPYIQTERGIPTPPKWWQLAFGVLCMAMIANLQYGWTLFVDPIDSKFHWGRAAIQIAFTIFVATETWLVPVETWFVDTLRSRGSWSASAAGMIALAWVINAYADSLTLLYVGAVVGGIGAGSSTAPASATPQSGSPIAAVSQPALTAAGFGAGAAIHRGPDRQDDRVERLRIRLPHLRHRSGPRGDRPCRSAAQAARPHTPVQRKSVRVPADQGRRTPKQAVRTPVFWVMYAIVRHGRLGGLMAAAQIAPSPTTSRSRACQ